MIENFGWLIDFLNSEAGHLTMLGITCGPPILAVLFGLALGFKGISEAAERMRPW